MWRGGLGGRGRSRSLLVCVPALGALLACGGHATSAVPTLHDSPDATSIAADAGLDARPIAPDADASTPGCAACTDAADADAWDGTGALADQEADANPAIDAVCHVFWPQPLYLDAQGIQMAVDASGDVFLAITYSAVSYMTDSTTGPSLDLGVTLSTTYPIGVAIAKVDSTCHLLWMREIGGVSGDSVGIRAIAVDDQSNVIVMGEFSGNVDFSGITLGIPDGGVSGGGSLPYLMGFDTTGQVLFRQVLTHGRLHGDERGIVGCQSRRHLDARSLGGEPRLGRRWRARRCRALHRAIRQDGTEGLSKHPVDGRPGGCPGHVHGR